MSNENELNNPYTTLNAPKSNVNVLDNRQFGQPHNTRNSLHVQV
jgi:hypothetical protein